jgi:CRISPR/Cas system CSM-associated protein Csm4 (group 5 of RAMP superfamily)
MTNSFQDMMREFNDREKEKDLKAGKLLLEQIYKGYDAAVKEKDKAWKELRKELDELEVRSRDKNKAIRFIEEDPQNANLVAFVYAITEYRDQESIVSNARIFFNIAVDKASKIYASIDAVRRLKNATNDLATLGYTPKDFG